jgi:hypothetical protein
MLSLSLLALPALADEEAVTLEPEKKPFYQWVNPVTGTIEATNDAKRIPEKFKSIAEQRRWEDVGQDIPFTPYMMKAEDYYDAVSRSLERYRAINARVLAETIPEPPLDFPYPGPYRLRGTRELSQDLEIGGGTVVIMQERFNVDGINEEMYVLYGPNGERLRIAPFPIYDVYQELPYNQPHFR